MLIFTILLILTLSFSQNISAQFQSIDVNGEQVYVHGVNLPWINFGWDFGEHHLWGSSFDKNHWNNDFKTLSNHGVNTVRIWIHCDGRANPEFDSLGYVTGLDQYFLEQLEAVNQLAEQYNLYLILCLWSHDLLEDNRASAGRYAGMHADLIRHKDKTQSYIDNALIPMVNTLKHSCNILAWEIFNEPEWTMRVPRGGMTKQTVSKGEMQNFVGTCVKAIRQNCQHNITIGAAIPWGNEPVEHCNYWHEDAFLSLGFDWREVYFDFYSFHYYNTMGKGRSPFCKKAQYFQMARPIIIAECSSTQGLSPEDKLEKCKDNDYAGLLFWSYQAKDKHSDWSNMQNAVHSFASANPMTAVNTACNQVARANTLKICKAYPNPFKDFLEIHLDDPDQLYSYIMRIYRFDGQLVYQQKQPSKVQTLNLSNLATGMYYLEIELINPKEQSVQIWAEKIIKLP